MAIICGDTDWNKDLKMCLLCHKTLIILSLLIQRTKQTEF